MSRVRYQSAVSIDGYIAPEDGSIEWLEPFNDVGADFMNEFMNEIGGTIVGRTTFDQAMAMGGAKMFGSQPTLVMTSRPPDDALPDNFILASGDPAAALARLKAKMKQGDIWLMGGGRTAALFLEAGLIDLLELTTVPVLLGSGRPLFSGRTPPRTFSLASSVAGKLGTVSSVYKRA